MSNLYVFEVQVEGDNEKEAQESLAEGDFEEAILKEKL